jgi:peptide deformylase
VSETSICDRYHMAILEILHFPDPRLRQRAREVERVDDQLRALIDAMFATMYQAPGIGLAATQVNVHKRVVVIDISKDQDRPQVFINPEILAKEGVEEMDEGCLSVPGVYERVQRAERITVRALNRDGEPFELETDGLLAVCIQHEIDHLDGKLFVDYLSQLKRQRIRKKLEKQKRLGVDETGAVEKHAEPVI